MWIHCNEMQWSDALKGVSMGLHDPAPFPLDWEFFGHSKSATLLEMGLHSIRLLENCQSKNECGLGLYESGHDTHEDSVHCNGNVLETCCSQDTKPL